METKKLYLNSEEREASLERAAEILKKGGLVAIPTETVYGLSASAFSDEAVKKIFLAKGRPQDNPLIVHISDLKQLKGIVSQFPESAKKLCQKFWPGPLTLVLPKGEKVCESVSAGLDTVAVRMPKNETTLEVISRSGLPLAAPSANLSGSPSPTKAAHVIADLDGKIDAVLMDKDCSVGVESTVVTLATNPPRLLRPGAVTVEQLKAFLPDLEVDKAVLSELKSGEKAASPGMKYKHYAPKCEVYLVEATTEAFCNFVNEKEGAVALCFESESEKITISKMVYGREDSAETLAANLFDSLRELDKTGAKEAFVHAPEKTGVGLAVYNRLIRAAGFKVIRVEPIAPDK